MLQLPSIIATMRARPRAALAVLLLAGVMAAAVAPAARAADPYRVGDVAVSAKGKTATAAKERAIARGMPVALRRLLRRITTPADFKRLSAVRWRGIRALVAGYEVEHERATGNHYKGVLAYRFDRGKVRGWLRGQKVRVVDAVSRPVLVLPVWRAKRGPLLWDEPNPWRQAWQTLDHPDGLVPIVNGAGDLADLQAIDGDQAVAGERAALATIARRYKAGSVVVAVAVPAGDKVRITVRRYIMPGGPARELGIVSTRTGEASLRKAAGRIVAAIEATWKQRNEIDDTATTTLRAVAPLDGLAYWTKLRARLDSVALIKRYRVVQFATNRSILDIVHAGSPAQLESALTEAGLRLRRDAAADRWVLRLAEEPAPPAPPAPPPRRRDDRRP